MWVEFQHVWSNYKAGEIVDIEKSLSNRLVGLGVCKFITDHSKRTTPEIKAKPKRKPVVEEKVKAKKPPKRKYVKREKAVSIE